MKNKDPSLSLQKIKVNDINLTQDMLMIDPQYDDKIVLYFNQTPQM